MASVMRVCSACGKENPETTEYFYRRSTGELRGPCKACAASSAARRYKANPGPQKERIERWREENQERSRLIQRKSHLRLKFGLSLEDYERMYREQGGVCAVCHSVPMPRRWFTVDHDHSTGKFRGLLCGPCNTMLGQARDDSSRLRAGADYLDRFSERQKDSDGKIIVFPHQGSEVSDPLPEGVQSK
jgi:hypothetical protein